MDVLFDNIDEGTNFGNKAPFFVLKQWTLLAIFCAFLTNSFAQLDTTIYIGVMDVEATHLKNDGTGSVAKHFEKEILDDYHNQPLSNLLQEKANVFIKSYGTSSLATISLRGTGSNHTAVLWNGLNLQSSMNGTVDFNLVPVFFMEKIDLQKGGSSARYGSGAIGGSLHLNSAQKTENGFHGSIGSTIGSFGRREALGKLSVGHKKWHSTVKLLNRSAKNDFKLPKNPTIRQTNATFDQQGITNDNYLKINEQQSLRSYFWYQKTERQIPPSRSEGNSDAQQNDDFLRTGIDWNRVGETTSTKAKMAFLQDELLFFSAVVDSSKSLTRMYVFELEQDFFLKKQQTLRMGFQYHRRWAKADGFDQNQLQNRTALWASYQRFFWQEKLHWTTNLRQELVDAELIPFTGSTGANLQLNDYFNFRLKISKNYNLPTFNDLFWADGFGQGNADLQPEEGWSEEIGVDFSKKLKNFDFNFGITAFNSTIENWILWQPTGSTWQPQNERKVRARGLETSIDAAYSKGNWQFFTIFNYAYTKSTIEKINDGDNPRQLGKQLLYVPVHTSSFTAKITRKNTFLSYQQQLVGKRQTTRDNNDAEAVDAYETAQLLMGHDFYFGNKKLAIQLVIHNVWNEDFEVIAFRPMPGRHFFVSGVFEF